jgi:uncharacterized protein YkwD
MRRATASNRAALVALVALAVAPAAHAHEPGWAPWSASPVALDPAPLEPLEREALDACGPGDAGLRQTAGAILERKRRGLPMPDLDAIAAAQRAAGEPHPWARAWAVSAASLERDAVLPRLRAWVGMGRWAKLRRCGVATGVSRDGTRTLVVVAVDALADLAPLPTRARAGQWLSVEARLRVPARGGRVVLLGPSGAPRTVPSWFDGSTLRARFAPDRPGELSVQVVADLAGGPRPVLEASVLADVEPPTTDAGQPAPGEDVATAATDADTLAAMIAAARSASAVPALARDPRLDAVAARHAERMARTHELAHDAGDGDPAERVRAEGVDARDLGENVAHAPTLALAHRALWKSPSHRANLLGPFVRFGVAVVRDERAEPGSSRSSFAEATSSAAAAGSRCPPG